MGKDQKKLLTKKITKGFLSTLVIAVFYIAFRFLAGPIIYNQTSAKLNLALSSNGGQTLSQISLPGESLFDQKSTILLTDGYQYLSGTTAISTTNPKILAMRKFLIDYNSPMYPYADVFVNEAEKFKLDWRLVASISGVESAFGTITPYRTNNAWGWKGGPGGNWSIFANWGEGIKTISRGLSTGYANLTPFQIEPRYCPPCYANPQHAWANGVTKFQNELDYYLKNLEKM